MRSKTIRWAVVLAAGLGLMQGMAHGEGIGPGPEGPGPGTLGYAPPDCILPTPLGSTRPEDGGFFFAGGFVMYHASNPLKSQGIAFRGFQDTDGSITQALTGTADPGHIYGTQNEAVNSAQVSGTQKYQPGWFMDLGWKFENGGVLTFDWMRITEFKNTAIISFIPQGGRLGPQFTESFLFSPVFNFPNQFAGVAQKVAIGNQFATYGIWNAASIEQLEYIQRITQFEMTYRQPIYQTEYYRLSGLTGPRFFWIWERFRWLTIDLDVASGASDASTNADYTNIVSNRMYGWKLGCSHEAYLGNGFALSLDLQAAVFMDIVREKAQYSLQAKHIPPVSKKTYTDYTIVPELQATPYVMWYPYEFIQIKFGFDYMLFFNTIGSPRPVDFNWGDVSPGYERVTRWLMGWQAGISFIF
jgi:hypothetical protein